MVKIPALELDGQNWKIYRAKLLEHAATKGWLGVLAGELDNEDWEGCNALLHKLLHDTIPISIYIRLHRNTVHQVFKYLAKRFRDRNPITDPRAKKLATCANEDKRHPSAESPTSENAAIGAEREDPPTKALTRGTKDVDDRNVGREDPRTSLEASAKGNSAESAGTTVILESAPHETQNQPQNSLQTTPRLPTEGKPSECEREVAESVVIAGCMKGMVGTANLPEMDADVDVDRTALLGREPAERASGVDEGDETERDSQSQLQQTNLPYEESCQRNENARENVPSAQRLPLEGEWIVCASGETNDSKGNANTSNAAVEHADGSSRSKEVGDTMENKSEGCEGGTSGRESVDELIVECCQQLCMADTQNESRTLVITSIESESPDSGEIPRIRLGGTSWHAGDANGAGNRTEGSGGQADASTGWTDTLDVSNGAETAVID